MASRAGAPGGSPTPAALGLVAAILQVNFLFEHLVPTGLAWRDSQVSDLSAVGQPWSWTFRLGDVVAGLLLLVLLGPLRRTLPGRAGLAAVAMLGLFAAGLLAAAIAREDCLPGVEPACVVDALAGSPPFSQDWLHDVASIVSVTGIVVLPAPAFWALRQRGERRRAWLALGVGLVSLALALVASTEILLAPDPSISVLQRVQVLLVSVQLCLLFVGRARP